MSTVYSLYTTLVHQLYQGLFNPGTRSFSGLYIFTIDSQNVHYMFTICLIYIHYMYVHYIFTICNIRAPNIFRSI